MSLSMIPAATTAVTGAMSNYAAAKQNKATADYNAAVSEQQAKLAENAAANTRRQGYDDMQQKKVDNSLALGALRAKQGASGAVTDIGSSLDTALDTTERNAADAAKIYENANDSAYSQQVSAWQSKVDAARQRANGKNAMKNAKYRTILGGINSGMSKLADGADYVFGSK